MSQEPFTAELFTGEGKGAWTFVKVPPELAPPIIGNWGMTPVEATMDGKLWLTTLWRSKIGEYWLPLPKKVRQGKKAGDAAHFTIRLSNHW